MCQLPLSMVYEHPFTKCYTSNFKCSAFDPKVFVALKNICDDISDNLQWKTDYNSRLRVWLNMLFKLYGLVLRLYKEHHILMSRINLQK